MISVVLSARSLPSRAWSHQLRSEALPSLAPELINQVDILVLQALNRSEPSPTPCKAGQSSSAASFSRLRSGFCQPFNTHRAGVVQRFSPIHF